MRRMIVGLALVVLAMACGRLDGDGTGPGDGPGSPEGPPSEPAVDERTVAIHAAVIRALYETEGWYRTIYVLDRPCEKGVGDREPECGGPLDDPTLQAIADELTELPTIEFVSDPDPVQDRIFEGTAPEASVLMRFGEVAGNGDRVEVPTSAYCGGLCGHWMTLVVERTDRGWTVTGTTGPVAIS